MDGVRRRDLRPPARRPTMAQVRALRLAAVLCVLGGLACGAVYAAVVPALWAGRDWSTTGSLDLTQARPPTDDPVLPGALSGHELVQIEDAEYGLCDVQRIAAAEVRGRRVAVIHDLSEDRSLCAVTIRDAGTGEEIVGSDASAVAKAGGFWPDVGPVKTELELWLGGIAALVLPVGAMRAFRLSTEHGHRSLITERMILDALDAQGGQDRPTLEDWTWDNLVLTETTRRELLQVQRLLENTAEAHAYGVHPPSGMLLTGPPGTGKTTVARVLAAQARCSFYPVTVADVLSKWVGESEAQVQRLFARARANAPSIVFLDEIDAIGGRRGHESTSGDRLLNQLLAEMDGMAGRSDVFVLAATNRPDVLDPALLRGGRLSRQVEIGLPDARGRRRLLEIYTRSMPLEGVDLDEVVAWTSGFSGADIAALCQQAAIQAMIEADATRTPGIPPRREVSARDFDRALSTMIEQRSTGGS